MLSVSFITNLCWKKKAVNHKFYSEPFKGLVGQVRFRLTPEEPRARRWSDVGIRYQAMTSGD
jgi:hypothetical protein